MLSHASRAAIPLNKTIAIPVAAVLNADDAPGTAGAGAPGMAEDVYAGEAETSDVASWRHGSMSGSRRHRASSERQNTY